MPAVTPSIIPITARQSVHPRRSVKPVTMPAPTPVIKTYGRTQTHVLVIDDDDMVRRALARSLKRKYDVTEVGDAESALEMIVNGGMQFDAILCDLHMIGMSGREFLMRLSILDPEHASRVVILSGCCASGFDDALLAKLKTRFLEKPATLAEIDAVLADFVPTHAKAA